MKPWWADPGAWKALGGLSASLTIIGALCYALHLVAEHYERRTPEFRRELEARYAQFHSFLLAVRCAAFRSLE
jgi:hypothetical protein